jgi:hypothetical protein
VNRGPLLHGEWARVRAGTLATIALLVMAYALYEPLDPRPFDYVDFPENVLLLRSLNGFAERYGALVRTYLEHGRWSPITLAAIAGQWSLFEWWTPGWQVFRFVVMAVAVVLAQRLSRRLGLTVIGAFAAAMLLVASPAAIPGWTRLSSAEPLGMLFLLIGCHLALRPRTRATSVSFALALLGVMWTKEIMAVAFALPLLLFLLVGEDALPKARWTRARSAWLLPAAFAFVLGSIPVLWTWLSAPAGSFASRYARRSVSLGDVAGGSLAALLPFSPVPFGSASALLVVVAAFLLLVLAGWRKALFPGTAREQRRLLLILALGIPVLGAVIYSPWPFYLLLYALPFMIAGSLLFGQATSSLFSEGGRDRIIGAICLTIVLTFSVMQAANEASRTRALHRVVAESVVRVSAMRDVDSVLVEVAAAQFDSSGNFGPRFKTYARMLGLEWPNVRDVRCSDSSRSSDHVMLLSINLMCPPHSLTSPAIVRRHNRFDWPNPWPRIDSVTVSFRRYSP